MISDYTALYTELDRRYSESMSGPYQDLSTESTVAAIHGGKITGYWRPVIIVDNHMDEIRRLWDVSREILYVDYQPVSAASKWLLSHGYEASPYYTHVIDIRNHVWSDIRKSYQNLINRDLQNCVIRKDVMSFMKLHQELSGRKTRPPKSWKIQQKMVDKDEAFLVRNETGGVLIMTGPTWAYYASGKCNGNSHALIYAAIEECKRRGIRYLEMGEQVYFGNEKMVNISNFKRGFGGKTIMRLICKPKGR